MVGTYGTEFVRQAIRNAKSPTWRQALALIDAFDWFGSFELTDAQAAVLDSIVYRSMRHEMRRKAFKWIEENKSAQEIEDLLEANGPSGQAAPPAPVVTEDDVRMAYARALEADGWTVRTEQPTRDGGAVDIIATRDGVSRIVECKVDLNRDAAIFALGQLLLYSQTFTTDDWEIGYWRRDKSAEPVGEAVRGRARMVKIAIQEPGAREH